MLKRNLFFLFAITVFAIASTILDIYNYNPYESSTKVFMNFYISFFFAFAGVIAITVYTVKYKITGDKSINLFFWPSIRQGCLLSASLTILLVLNGLNLLDVWVGASSVFAILLLEFFFQTNSSLMKKIKSKGEKW